MRLSSHIANASIHTADGRFKEAISFYEPLVQGHLENLLEVTAIVLANLCVCYIMTSQNDQAEALMRQVERQEEQQALAVSTLSCHTTSQVIFKDIHALPGSPLCHQALQGLCRIIFVYPCKGYVDLFVC